MSVEDRRLRDILADLAAEEKGTWYIFFKARSSPGQRGTERGLQEVMIAEKRGILVVLITEDKINSGRIIWKAKRESYCKNSMVWCDTDCSSVCPYQQL